MAVLLFIRKLNQALLKAAGWGVVAAMAVIAAVIPYAVFARYVLRDMPPWSDEVALFSLVWASMLGAAVSLEKGYQVGITFFLTRTSRTVSALLRVAGFVLMLLFFVLAIVFGLRQTLFNLRQLSAALRAPMAVPYAALPLGFFLMLLVTLEGLLAFVLGVDRAGKAVGPGGGG